MPRYRWTFEDRHGRWHQTRRECLRSARIARLLTSDPETGALVAHPGLVIETDDPATKFP